MRRHASSDPAPASAADKRTRSEWGVLKTLVPYLWDFKWRVMLALAFLVAAKFGNVGVPLVLKRIVDALSIKPTDPAAVLVLPVSLLVAYGLLRLATTTFTLSATLRTARCVTFAKTSSRSSVKVVVVRRSAP